MRHDVGTATTSSGLGIGEPLEGVGFETPTLLGLWESGPYLHDGSARTLGEVLDRHGDIPAIPNRDDLLRYLLEIDSTSLPPEAPCDSGPNECVGGEMMPMPDAGVPMMDAGQTTPDGGPMKPAQDAGVMDPDTPEEKSEGCGCNTSSGEASLFALLFLALLAFRVRARP